ncbi:bifunctional nuclease domain-containing protein [Alkalilimnicola ehrlichii]|uniref:bifunctional nuclease domain-containing protein n=1 Tax=Alkalilimnicola ehrlichii TaxID=351052 RepID=UPI000E2F9862|nr:bifunctional nuclease domain-containing protein [Alkalilimnicola ehrlichii]
MLGLAVGVLLVLAELPANARELAAAPEDLILVELATVGLAGDQGPPLVLLREPDSGDVVPIFIGMNEARAILMALHDVAVPRPMTHDLIGNVLDALDARLERVIVDDLVNGTYLGAIELRVEGQESPKLVDSRPSDAMALAARLGASIYVSTKVLRAAPELDFRPFDGEQVVSAIGLTVVDATTELREALQLPDDQGVLVSRATGAAADAGINPGSLLLQVNDSVPQSPLEFLQAVRETPAGAEAEIHYWQDGRRHEVSLPTDVPTVEDSSAGQRI